MQASTGTAGTGLAVAIGIHDLLEQSISRSRLDGSNESASPSAQKPTSSQQLRNGTSTPRPQSKNGRWQDGADLQAATASQVGTPRQAGTPRASTAFWHDEGISHMNRTALPERRQIAYSSPEAAGNQVADLSTSNRSSNPQVNLDIQFSTLSALASHLCSTLSACCARGLPRRGQSELLGCLLL